MKFLIDGENFRHQIAHILMAHHKIDEKNTFFTFDLAGFCSDLLSERPVDIVYYTTRIKQPTHKVPVRLSTMIAKISAANRKWIAQLANQKITVIKAGHLRVRETSACVHCGKKTLVLQEKGVDVRVAVDLLLALQSSGSRVALGSSDSDIVPSLEIARRAGAKITYVCYAGQLNRAIAAQVDKVITFDDADVLKYFGRKP